jgi:hypothetical protein
MSSLKKVTSRRQRPSRWLFNYGKVFFSLFSEAAIGVPKAESYFTVTLIEHLGDHMIWLIHVFYLNLLRIKPGIAAYSTEKLNQCASKANRLQPFSLAMIISAATRNDVMQNLQPF